MTVPTHKLLADTRWLLDAGAGEVRARSGMRDAGRTTRGVHVFVQGRGMLENTTYGPFERRVDDSPLIQVPGPGAVLVARGAHFAAYADC
ncbi:MAG: hypothetical protein HZB46_10640 [Solirubrobacterales bacterium]|nr:hypothetical protein [Solirubrobacterales bacterium]